MIKSINVFTILALSIVLFGNTIFAQGTIKSVKIGNQVWMVENLNVDKFRNGDLIPEAKTDYEWEWKGKPAWCYYRNDSENGEKYGKLYNWYAVNDKRGLAPEGWHIPTLEEFRELAASVNHNGNDLKAIGQGREIGAGTNTSGFSALFGGYRKEYSIFDGLFGFIGFWSTTEYNTTTDADFMYLNYVTSKIEFYYGNKYDGFSIRCVKN